MNSVLKQSRKGTEEKGQKVVIEKASESKQFFKTHTTNVYM